MRTHTVSRWLLTAVALIFSAGAAAQVRISEFHYDNASTDVGEAVEVSAPAGTDLTGWQVVLYNGNGGAPYGALNLSGIVPATCGTRGVVVLQGPSDGIQNGDPDGLALVNAAGTLVEFLSYEGVFAGVGGAADQITSVDVGVAESSLVPVGMSLARNAAGAWSGPAPNTFDSCNDNGDTPPGPEVASVRVTPLTITISAATSTSFVATALDIDDELIFGTPFTWTSTNTAVARVNSSGVATGLSEGDTTIVATASNGVSGSAVLHVTPATPLPPSNFHINEIHYDNAGTDAGEAIEIEGPAGADISGYRVVLFNGNGGAAYNTRTLSGFLPNSCGTRGVLTLTYPPNDGIQNGDPDGIALVDSLGQVLEFLSYEGVFTATSEPAAGRMSIDIIASQNGAPDGSSLQRSSSGVWASGLSSFGACNPDVPIPVGNTLSFSGRVPSDPALPVGYEDQIFATLRSPTNVAIPTTITWTSETPTVASIDANGVMLALAAGTATVRATATDGTTSTYSLPTRVAVESGVAYPGNTEFGIPADSDPIDDFIVRHEQFTASYNQNRGTPNWVSYNLDAAHFGTEDRCDCFTMDPELPATFPRISTNDYTGSSDLSEFDIDRGHLVRSFDRTTGSLDNARTFLFSNVVPQASDLNQGPWAAFESYLGAQATVEGREVYIVTGVAGDQGTLKDELKVVIPEWTWKVAVLMPHDQGLANIVDYRDLEVIAVNMPNIGGVRNRNWTEFRTTVDAIETLTGYDLLALLPNKVESAVESNTQPPLASLTGPAGDIAEGSSATFDASTSFDPNGSIASYAWVFGDGSTSTGTDASVAHTYVQDGEFTVTVTVTDNDGLTDSATFTLNVTNVAPVVGAVPDATLNVGATHTAAGTFTDPGADVWTATVNWGDGSALEVVPLSGHNFSLTHIYTAAGTYAVTIQIRDDDTSSSTTHSVTVEAPAPESGLAEALPIIDELIATGKIPRGVGILWKAEVIAAQVLIGRGNEAAAVRVLQLEVAQIDALVHCRVVKAADVAPLRKVLVDAIEDLGGTVESRRHRHRR